MRLQMQGCPVGNIINLFSLEQCQERQDDGLDNRKFRIVRR